MLATGRLIRTAGSLRQSPFPRASSCVRGSFSSAAVTAMGYSRCASLRSSSTIGARVVGMPKGLSGRCSRAGRLGTGGARRGTLSKGACTPSLSRSIAVTAMTRAGRSVVRPGSGLARGSSASGSKRSASFNALSSRFHAARHSDKAVLYVLLGLHGLGTAVWIVDYYSFGRYTTFLENNLCVSFASTVRDGRYHTLVTAVFAHREIISSLVGGYLLYQLGSLAIAVGGPGFLLAAYVGGGVFGQVCQVLGPTMSIATPFKALKVGAVFPMCGWSGIETLLVWYCATYPFSRLLFLGVFPVPVVAIGALTLGGIAYTIATDGMKPIPFLSSDARHVWRDLGSIAAGVGFAFALARRPQMFISFWKRRF